LILVRYNIDLLDKQKRVDIQLKVLDLVNKFSDKIGIKVPYIWIRSDFSNASDIINKVITGVLDCITKALEHKL